MYSKNSSSIPLPETGHLHILKNGYVYWEESCKWDSINKRPASGRSCIGKLDPSKERYFFPNKTYHTIFDSEPETEAPVEPKELKPVPAPKQSPVLNFGPYIALFCAASKTGCLDALQKVFPEDWTAIFALALHAIDSNFTAQDFPFWFFHNYCGLNDPLSSSTISRIYQRIGEDPDLIKNFLYFFRENYMENFPEPTRRAVAFDSTNQNTNSDNIELAEYGHSKIKENLPTINTALFVDEKTGIPFYYEHFYGSVLDKAQTPFTMEKVEDLGFQKLFLMMDRGYCSKNALNALKNQEFAVMASGRLTIVHEVIKEYRQEIKDNESHYIPVEDIYGMHIGQRKVFGEEYEMYVYYDEKRASAEKASIHARIKFIKEQAERRKRYTEKLAKQYEKWLNIEPYPDHEKGKRNFKVSVRTEEVQKAIDEAGYFVVLSNTELTAEEMIVIARMRDRSEKCFRHLKSYLDLSKTYMHSLETYEGKMFVAFVALIILESYRWMIKDILNVTTSETTATSLSEMRKCQIYNNQKENTWTLMYALTRKQKNILSKFDINEKQLRSIIEGLTRS